MKTTLLYISLLILGIYLLLSRSAWLSSFERHITISQNPYISKSIDLSKSGVIKLLIKPADWNYNDGIADIFLICERPNAAKSDDYWNHDFDLKVKINAYALTDNKKSFPRLITNYFMPSDEPMASTTKLWAGWPNERLEYRLGRVLRFPMEDTVVEVTVLAPDDVLAKANPRLKIIGDHDSAVIGHIYLLRLIRDAALVLCLISLAILVFFSWKYISIAPEDNKGAD